MTRQRITYERARELVSYDPETGLLRWSKSRRACKIGSVCGNVAKDGYIRIGLDYRSYQAHQIIWLLQTGEWPEGEIDHINHNPSDNRWCNLRLVSHAQNLRNMARSKRNTSGVTGVTWNARERRWIAVIRVNRKAVSLGGYAVFEDAVAARRKAERIHGFHPNHGKPRNYASGGTNND